MSATSPDGRAAVSLAAAGPAARARCSQCGGKFDAPPVLLLLLRVALRCPGATTAPSGSDSEGEVRKKNAAVRMAQHAENYRVAIKRGKEDKAGVRRDASVRPSRPLLTLSRSLFLSLSLSLFPLSRQTKNTQYRGPGVSDSNAFIQVLDDAIAAVTNWISGEKIRIYFLLPPPTFVYRFSLLSPR